MTFIELLLGRAYLQHALVAAIAVGLVCSLLSVIVVLKRMAFMGQGISHAGFGGVGTAVLLGYTGSVYSWQYDLTLLVFCLGAAVLIGLLTSGRRVESDSAIGILLAATMAWGALAYNLRVEWQRTWAAYREWIGPAEPPPSWESVLFGSLLEVGAEGMWMAVGMCALVIGVCAAMHRHLIFYAFDETVSRVFGVRAAVLHYLLLVLLALIVVVSIRLVGLILVSALLIIPGATALLLSRRLHAVLILAAAVGVVGCVGGLVVSIEVGYLSPGAAIVAVLSAFFAAAYLRHRFSRLLRPRLSART